MNVLYCLHYMFGKKSVKIWSMIVVIGLTCFSGYAFAAEGTGSEGVGGMAYLLNFAVSILSWVWILVADLAGKFLTNSRVYGEVIGLDSLLWQYRVVVRNFANFGLGFYFIYVVFRALINKDDITKKIKDVLLWILVGGVGIQVSWFFTAAIIDVSTITLVAAGSLPAQLVAKDNKIQQAYEKNMSVYFDGVYDYYSTGKLINLFPTEGTTSDFIGTYPITMERGLTKEQLFDKLMPTSEDISGPLYYIGFCILRANMIPTVKSDSENALKETIFNIVLQGGTTIVYSIEMLVLLILAVMRVLYLWIFIILSPLVILLWSIDKSGGLGGKGKDGFLSSITTHINLESFFINVFKPTIIVLGISLTVIFTTLMRGVIIDKADTEIDINGVKMVSKKNETITNRPDITYTTTLDTNLLKFTLIEAFQTLLGLFLSIITVILMYIIIKIAVNMGGGKDFVSKGIKKVQDMSDKLVTSVPIVPVSGYDDYGDKKTHYISARGVPQLFTTIKDNKIYEMNKEVSAESDDLSKALGLIKDDSLSNTDWFNIRNAGKNLYGINKLEKIREVIVGLRTEEGKKVTLDTNTPNGKQWTEIFTDWLNNLQREETGEFSGIKKAWDDLKEGDKTLENLFNKNGKNGKNFAKIYAEYFGYSGDGVTGFNNIKTLDITKKPKQPK